MRNFIVSTAFAAALLVGGAAAWQANAAAGNAGTSAAAAAATIVQVQEVRCFRNAPRDGCGFGRFRGRWGGCRPC